MNDEKKCRLKRKTDTHQPEMNTFVNYVIRKEFLSEAKKNQQHANECSKFDDEELQIFLSWPLQMKRILVCWDEFGKVNSTAMQEEGVVVVVNLYFKARRQLLSSL